MFRKIHTACLKGISWCLESLVRYLDELFSDSIKSEMIVRLYTRTGFAEECIYVGTATAELRHVGADVHVQRVKLPIRQLCAEPGEVPDINRATISLPYFPEHEIQVKIPIPLFLDRRPSILMLGDATGTPLAVISN